MTEKRYEPGVLRSGLERLFEHYPGLRLLTMDALYAERDLCHAIVTYGRDYMVRVKGNRPTLLSALCEGFAETEADRPQAETEDKEGRYHLMKFAVIAILAGLTLVGCTASSTFDVVVTDDNHVTVWDSSGRGYSIPMEDVTIHGMENLPEPTATPKAQSTPTPYPTPAPIPTPIPGVVIDINEGWGNPFLLKQYEGMQVTLNVNVDRISFEHIAGWPNTGGNYAKCHFPDEIPDSAARLLAMLEIHQPVTLIGLLRHDDDNDRHELYDCLPHQLVEGE